jgi:CRP-like cAMP-binding protein
MQNSGFKNSLLKSLAPEIIDRLRLRRVAFKVGQDIEFPGKPVKHLFFVEEGMASQTVTLLDGSQVEVGMFGYESVTGVCSLMGNKQSLNRVYTQIEGYGYSCKYEVAKREFDSCGAFQSITLRYVQAQLLQVMQSAACNAKHEVEQRLARWLLLCADRTHTHTLKLSQEFIAHMLGIGRPSVSVAAAVLKNENLIDYKRGTIRIVDIAGLERRSCECYRAIKNHLDNYTEFDSGTVA